MKIEPFGKYIALIYRNSQSIINKKFENYDIGSGQYNFLYVICNNDGLTQKELGEILEIGKPTIAKTVKALEKSGYVRREKDLDDKRFYRVYLTEKGKEITPLVNESFKEMADICKAGFSEEEFNILLKLLNKALKNIYEVKNQNN